MTGMSAGVLRSRKASWPICRPKAARVGGLGAHAGNRLGRAQPEHAGTDFGPASKTVLGPEASRVTGTEPDQNRQAWTAGTELLPRQRILLGRSHSLCAAHAVEGRARLGFLEWPGVENYSWSRKRAAQRAINPVAETS